ncbi:hypothetical protein HID58_093952 [Brassica napus]|uniref:Uncharacterized protein n=1 Tax=Brassica napus TaxID=3708 RepID=A0ABQ7XB44_BRANA|nr:hypothetical protein HID58_093956 [Brassica napus]KAH0852569.1 hypothetical protein HID58_093952 [Brassica napus]
MARVDCSNLARSSSPSFPYYRDWNFGVDSNLKPKICITTSTSAGLDQILPWMFYHKKDLNKPLIIAAKTNMEVLLEVVEEEAKLVVAKPQRQ